MPSDRWMDKDVVCIYPHIYVHNGILKKNKIMPFAATWKDQEIIILSEINHKEKDKYCVVSLILESKIWHNELVYKTEIDSDTEKRLVVAEGERDWGGKDWEFGISRCKLWYTEWINNKVLLYCKGNNIQYSVINYNGEEYLCVYSWVTLL